MFERLFGRKSVAGPRPGPQLGMPAFPTMAPPTADAIVSAWNTLFPDKPGIDPGESDSKEDVGDVLTFATGDRAIMLAHMPIPIPPGDIDGACERSWMWPTAADEMKKQRSHAVVAAAPDNDPVEAALAVSRLIGAACHACGAAGVYWGNGGQVHKPALFIDAVQSMHGPDSLPVMLWVGVMLSGSSRDGPFTLSTCGMHSFGHKEFEVLDSRCGPGDLRMRVYEAVNYVLTSGPVLKDGDTFGESAAERIRVEHTRSRLRKGEAVIRLHIP